MHYNVIYLGPKKQKIKIADFLKKESKYFFIYEKNSKLEFPGFNLKEKVFSSDNIWGQIESRVPTFIREEYPKKSIDELLEITNGALATDSFIFEKNIDNVSK